MHESELLLLKGFILCEAFPESAVQSDVLFLKFNEGPPKSHGIDEIQLELISHFHFTLLEAQMHHAL